MSKLCKGSHLPHTVPFFSLSTPPVPNTSHPTIPVEATFLRKAKCVWGGEGGKAKERNTKILPFSTPKTGKFY